MSRYTDDLSKAINYRNVYYHHAQNGSAVSVGNFGRKTNLALVSFGELAPYYKGRDTKPIIQTFITENRNDPDVQTVMHGTTIPAYPHANWAPFKHISPKGPNGARAVHALKRVLAKALPHACVYIDRDQLQKIKNQIQDFYPSFHSWDIDATGISMVSGMISRVLEGHSVKDLESYKVDGVYIQTMYDHIPRTILQYGNDMKLTSIRNYILHYAIFRMRGDTPHRQRTQILSLDSGVIETIYHVTRAMHTGKSLAHVRAILDARGGLPDGVLAQMILHSRPCDSSDAIQCMYDRFTYRQRMRSNVHRVFGEGEADGSKRMFRVGKLIQDIYDGLGGRHPEMINTLYSQLGLSGHSDEQKLSHVRAKVSELIMNQR